MDRIPLDRTEENPAMVLFRHLRAKGISYCHWKSNEHLKPGLVGDTDLDLLFRKEDAGLVDALLHETGFRRFEAVWYLRYPLVRDYLALDPESGKILHAHVHFSLILGESDVKNFILPWRDAYLRKSLEDRETGVMIASPEEELLVLLIRCAIKTRFPKPLRRLMKRRAGAPLEDERREFHWLRGHVSRDAVIALSAERLGPETEAVVARVFDNGLSDAALREFYLASRDTILGFRRCGPVAALVRRWARRLASLAGKVHSRSDILVFPTRHTACDGGMIVAILGTDGSGKSTLVKGLGAAISKKIDVKTLYLGSGQGRSGVLRFPLVLIRKGMSALRKVFRRRDRAEPGRQTLAHARSRKRSVLHTAFNFAWAVTLANEKRVKLRIAERARRRGFFVVTDRYPQTSIPEYNEAPLLSELSDSRWSILRKIARWEHRCYQHEIAPQPDLVLKLTANPETILSRRPELDRETVDVKQAMLQRHFDFPESTCVELIDANGSMDELRKEALRRIFRVFVAKRGAGNRR